MSGMAIGSLLLFREEYIWLVPPLMCGSAAYMWDVAPALLIRSHNVFH